jgi:uncharacterized protein
MDKSKSILLTETFVKNSLKGYDSGHDWWHIDRVRRLALFINQQELLADPFIVEISALLHDTVDSKFAGDNMESGYMKVEAFLDKIELKELREQIIRIIKNVSFSTKNPSGNLSDPVLQIIQDADRLDAIGAIGIARAFNFGGFRNNKIYDPEIEFSKANPDEKLFSTHPSTINHFYEKLLVLKYRMNTLTAKKLAIERHEFLELFLKQFYKEWEFNRDGIT